MRSAEGGRRGLCLEASTKDGNMELWKLSSELPGGGGGDIP